MGCRSRRLGECGVRLRDVGDRCGGVGVGCGVGVSG